MDTDELILRGHAISVVIGPDGRHNLVMGKPGESLIRRKPLTEEERQRLIADLQRDPTEVNTQRAADRAAAQMGVGSILVPGGNGNGNGHSPV